MGRSQSGGSREKGERRTVEVRKVAQRPRREPPSTPPQLCSASEQGRTIPAHGDSTLVPRTRHASQERELTGIPQGALSLTVFCLPASRSGLASCRLRLGSIST